MSSIPEMSNELGFLIEQRVHGFVVNHHEEYCHGVDVGNALLGMTLEHGTLAGSQNGIKAAQYGERQHHALVLRRPVADQYQVTMRWLIR